jgi:L-rhamnose mutarotase
MKTCRYFLTALVLCLVTGARAETRFGTITALKPEKVEYYKELHAKPWPKVMLRIDQSNIENYSIYLKEIDGQPILFSYFEYAGDNAAEDFARVGADPATVEWWKETDPCQEPLPGAARRGKIWDDLEEVFHTDGADDVAPAAIKRYASVTGLKLEKEAHYRTLHQTTWPSVLKQIKDANIRNYSIYLKDLGDKLYLFSYFEYVGSDFEGDMAAIAEDPATRRWWGQTDACQIPLPDAKEKGEMWSGMEEVFHTN